MKETILSAEKLNISYTKGQAKPTVREMDFEICKGEIIGLVGESGSGKSTFAKAVLGMLPFVQGNLTKNTNKIQMIYHKVKQIFEEK